MYRATEFNSNLLRDLDRADQAASQRHARDYASALARVTPMLEAAARDISQHWIEMPEDTQREIIELRERIAEQLRKVDAPKNPFTFVARMLYGIAGMAYRPQLLRFSIATSIFMSAVNSALALEERTIRAAEEAIAADGEAQAEIARGAESHAAGEGTVYTQAEFRRRFA
jgi:hypothetical protein